MLFDLWHAAKLGESFSTTFNAAGGATTRLAILRPFNLTKALYRLETTANCRVLQGDSTVTVTATTGTFVGRGMYAYFLVESKKDAYISVISDTASTGTILASLISEVKTLERSAATETGVAVFTVNNFLTGTWYFSKYDFTTLVWGAEATFAGTALLSPAQGFGNATTGYIGVDGDALAIKYLHATDVVSEHAAFMAVNGDYSGAAAGNSSKAVIYKTNSGGVGPTELFTFATEVSVTGGGAFHDSAGFTNKRAYLSAMGSPTIGYFRGGQSDDAPYDPTWSARIESYTYATDVVAAGTDGVQGSRSGNGAGTSTIGIWFLGESGVVAPSALTEKHTYATDVLASATALNTAVVNGAAQSSSAHAILTGTGGDAGLVQEYTFATDVVTSNATALPRDYSNSNTGNPSFGTANGGLQ